MILTEKLFHLCRRQLREQGVKEAKREAPENGLLVEGLIPIAGEVIAARNVVLEGVEHMMLGREALSCR